MGSQHDYNRASRFEGEFGVTDLTWETVEKLNVGTEIGLWNALDLQVDWFKEQRRDIFMQRNNIPSAAGFRKRRGQTMVRWIISVWICR